MGDSEVDPKLRWRCRRGMKEVEEVLIRFFEERYLSLSAVEQSCFADLLDQDDPDLFAWFIHSERPPDQKLAALVDRITDYVSS